MDAIRVIFLISINKINEVMFSYEYGKRCGPSREGSVEEGGPR